MYNNLQNGAVLHGTTYTYTIQKALGQGSFGITYLATTQIEMQGPLGTLSTTMKVAIKEFFMRDINGREGSTVTSGSKGDGLFERYRKKFIGEAKNLSKLNHPNIVKVLESFEANNTVYYAMEYIEGGSLDDLIRQKQRLSEDETLRYTRQIASALSYMHEHRMLHLDLKPGNIMIKDGNAVIIDFGLSKQYDDNGEPESSTTVGGGTPGYAPIEQANYHEGHGFPVTMDIYALGATMFKMLVGHTPPDASVILNEGFPKEELIKNGVSDRVIAVIEKAMATTKKARYQSVSSLLLALNNTVVDDVDKTEFEDTENTSTSGSQTDKESSFVNIESYDEMEEKSNGFVEKLKTFRIPIIVAIIVCVGIIIYNWSSKSVEKPKLEYFSDLSKIQVGDYLYANGKYTHVLDSANIDSCSGCVFNLITTDSEKEQGWTHGHIVALVDAVDKNGNNQFAWGPDEINKTIANHPNYAEAVLDKDGYLNCLGDSTGTYPAISSIRTPDEVNFKVPLPEGSSWYLPALGEWVDIIVNLGGIKLKYENESLMTYDNKRVSQILSKKANLMKEKEYGYWTSTQEGEDIGGIYENLVVSRAWAIYCEYNTGYVGNSPKSVKMSVRPVAAF